MENGDNFGRGSGKPRNGKPHYRGECYPCAASQTTKQINKDRDRHNKIRRLNYDKNKEKRREQKRQFRKANPNRQKEIAIRMNYKLEPADYLALLEQQNYECKICMTKLVAYERRTHIDHEKGTGFDWDKGLWNLDENGEIIPAKVRGILCGCCNTRLGHFKDNVVNIERAADYLRNSV